VNTPTTVECLLAAVVYLLVGRWLVWNPGPFRDFSFALLNLGAVFYFFFWDAARPAGAAVTMGLYVAIVLVQYAVFHFNSGGPGGAMARLAFFLPIAVLLIFRIQPVHSLFRLTGLSYLAFRTSYLVLEAQNGTVEKPGVWQYLGFAFFAPTLSVGPISPYALHRQGFAGARNPELPARRALLRVIIGLVKYRFLGSICEGLSYFPMLANGQVHHRVDVLIAAVAFYLYLYCNFSGFCDIAIGAAGLMGIPVAENFDHPFLARNIKDYWNRWHITLSQYLRDVLFSPMSKFLVRILGPSRINLAVAISIMTVFIVIGAWHGAGWNFVVFGFAHGLAVVANQYYTIGLKRWLGREQFAAYNRNPVIRAVAVVLTFLYVTAMLFIFNGSAMALDSVLRVFGLR
jgi:D-alanyl-lipoteichoic acid acyltransferase DltB (MBOAT superfamily)